MSTLSFLPGSRGRWVRRGESIVLLPFGPMDGGMEGELSVPVTATAAGVIDGRIDAFAQQALLRMAKSLDGAARSVAESMLGAVKAGSLGGIYKVDQQVPALRARSLGSNWWEVIPQATDAALLLGARAGEAPLVVYREAAKSLPARLDAALRVAWDAFVAFTDPNRQCQVAPPGALSADVIPGSILPAVFPRLVCQIRTPPVVRRQPPALTHFHTPVSLPGGGLSPVTVMTPAAMNPGFIDPPGGGPVITGSLQFSLEKLVQKHFSKTPHDVALALVDLSGARLLAPQLAGWHLTAAIEGGSLGKICAAYAARQLQFDLNAIAVRASASDGPTLVKAARAAWRAAGLVETQQPSIEALFAFTPVPGGVVTISPRSIGLADLMTCTFADSCNVSASLLIDAIGLPYISSLMLRSGLFHPQQGGLWLQGLYATRCDPTRPATPDNAVCNSPCCSSGRSLTKPFLPFTLAPAAHNVTALSVAAFFTLLAQGRLGDGPTSTRIANDLRPACSFFWNGQLSCLTGGRPPTKCGVTAGIFHDAILMSRSAGANCGAPAIRYVAVLLTRNGALPSSAAAHTRFEALLTDLDALIVANQPPPPPSPSPRPFVPRGFDSAARRSARTPAIRRGIR